MIYINNLDEAKMLFEALSSTTRIKIIELLQKNESMNMDSLAKSLEISNGALTSHIKKMSDCGLVNVKLSSIGHGTQKLCSLNESKIVIDLFDKTLSQPYKTLELNVGQYDSCKVSPTCGLCSKKDPLFDFDKPQFFKYPERFMAELLWFTDGFVSYTFPNPLEENTKLTELQISFEVSSEGPFAAKNCLAFLEFFANEHFLTSFESPGEFLDHKGKFTPDWWIYGQYGELVTISISGDGTYLNGLLASDYTIDNLISDSSEDAFISFKIGCKKTERHSGGATLFGKSFGDYPQGIVAKFFYKE